LNLLRKISLAAILGLGCVALAWWLFYLHGIFVDERDGALAEIAGRRRALEQFAHKELEQRLRDKLAEARPTIDAAHADPLIPAQEVLLREKGKQLLPRLDRARPGNDTPAADLFRRLETDSARVLEQALEDDPESPWTERLVLYRDLEQALAAHDRPAIERTMRGILAHRASYVISTVRDLGYTSAALALLMQRAQPERSLVEALLRTGVSGSVTRIEGMQRALLKNRPRFTTGDLVFLRDRIVSLCEPYNVLYDDFVARVNEGPGREIIVPADLNGPTLLEGGAWYVEPAGNQRVYGIALRLPAVLDEITSAMRERAMIGPDDEVRGPPTVPTAAISEVALDIESASWAPALASVEERYRLKAFLEFVIAVLVFGVMGLGAMIYRRRHRFLELKSYFVSAVSHELRTPLASIRLMAETLERRTKDLPRARDYPARIIKDVDGLSFLVENILSFNRLSRGRWTPKLERVRLGNIVDKLDAERDHWARKPAELERAPLQDVALVADPDLVQLLLTNLARNACQYNDKDTATVRIDAERRDASWIVTVADNGIGIPEGEAEKIFDDFYRSGAGKSSGERGSGLGLAICRKIMEAHGGTIRVEKTSAAGTTFELVFPDRVA
jgi:signal transduction histidine kinase